MEVVQALKEGRALIEKGWTQRKAARDASGKSCWAHSPLAASHCTIGAASAVTWDDPETTFSATILALAGALEDLWEVEVDEGIPWDAVEVLTKWNDALGRSKNEVLRLFDHAIALVETANEVPVTP